jgi:hypothetical protein
MMAPARLLAAQAVLLMELVMTRTWQLMQGGEQHYAELATAAL